LKFIAVDAVIAEQEKREEDVLNILENLKELNEIHKDLHGLVEEQEQHIKILGDNVVEAKENVASGVQHLDKAQEHQKAYRGKLCWLLMILLVVAIIIVIVFVSKK